MEQRKKNPQKKFITSPPAWLFLLLAVVMFLYLKANGALGDALAFSVSLGFLLISLATLGKLVQEKRTEFVGLPVQARLFKGLSSAKEWVSKGNNQAAHQTDNEVNENSLVTEEKQNELQEEYNKALEKLQDLRDQKAVGLLEKIASKTGDLRESEHVFPSAANNSSSSVILDLETTKSLSNERFEAVVAAYYHCRGFKADISIVPGGVDLILKKEVIEDEQAVIKSVAIVQIQLDNSGKADSRYIRSLYEKAVEEKIKKRVFITRSSFTTGSVKLARENKILLLDQRKFLKKVNVLPESLIKKIIAVASKED